MPSSTSMHAAAISGFPCVIEIGASGFRGFISAEGKRSWSVQRLRAGSLEPAKIPKAKTIGIREIDSFACSAILVNSSSSSLYRPQGFGSSGSFLAWHAAEETGRDKCRRGGGCLSQIALCEGSKVSGKLGQNALGKGDKVSLKLGQIALCKGRKVSGKLGQNALCKGSKVSAKSAAFSEIRWRCWKGDRCVPINLTTTYPSLPQIGLNSRDSVEFASSRSTPNDNKTRKARLRGSKPSGAFRFRAVASVSRVGFTAVTMELFKPQLVERVPFQFLSEYHAKPRVGPAAAGAARRDSMNPVCFFGMGQQNQPVVEIVQAGDPVLREPAAEVQKEEIGSARIEKIINDMVATMRNAPGVGLAAPQIGIPLQIIVLEDTTEYMRSSSREECEEQQRYPFDLLVIVNPKLKVKSGSGRAIFFEGCLSVNGYRALVERPLEVEVTGLGRDGRPITVEASGWKARILQHECDHLAGNLYVDKMISRSFRTGDQLRLPLPSGCPKPGVCRTSKKGFAV